MIMANRPETQEDIEACEAALHKLLSKYESRNEMARELRISRNSVTWWFKYGFIGYRAAKQIEEELGIPLKETRPDLDRERAQSSK